MNYITNYGDHYFGSDWFWDDHFWTPPNATFDLYETAEYRHFNDIYYSLYSALILLLIRSLLERLLYEPLGIYWFGIKRHPDKNHFQTILKNIYPSLTSQNVAMLEEIFEQTHGKMNHKINNKNNKERPQQQQLLTALTKQLDFSERQIQRWMRIRRQSARRPVLAKFCETAWRCTFYLSAFIYGIIILWDKPWTWDSVYCFIDYPHHTVSQSEWWYYNIETAFYLSLLASQCFDVKRKDFWIMFIHHCVTLILFIFSWACNLVRIGTLVIVMHDFADIPLEFGKMMAYAKRNLFADISFVVFSLFWIISRLIVFPYRIIYYSLIVAPRMLPMFNAYYFFNGFLLALQTMHIVWTYYIFKVALHTINNDSIRDVRSDDDDDDDEDNSDDEKDL